MQEIDDIIDNDDEEDEDEDDDGWRAGASAGINSTAADQPMPFVAPHSIRSSTFIGQALAGRQLEDLGVQELSQLLTDVETLVRDLSEELVKDLGTRDELEYEKVRFCLIPHSILIKICDNQYFERIKDCFVFTENHCFKLEHML